MGASNFYSVGTGKTADEAFERLGEQDRYENGHSYSGGIGMKHSFEIIVFPKGTRAAKKQAFEKAIHQWEFAGRSGNSFDVDTAKRDKIRAALTKKYHPINVGRMSDRYFDKSGPALCVEVPKGTYHFFGMASS